MSALLKLKDYGQSYWLDNLTRKMIINGELKSRVSEQGLRGMTSNPSIFNKAITKSEDYDNQITQLIEHNKSTLEIYEALTVKDVRDACDILRPVYDESDGIDGFVSLEVSPYLALDAEATMEEARRLFKAVNRPNVFIKIPGTDECVSAIEEMLYEDVNINITLLFSIQNYEAIAQAYIKALERRVREGKPIQNVSSVASFFLSRIDVLVDQLLKHRIIPGRKTSQSSLAQKLFGTVAIASAKLAYQSYKRIFSGDRWEALVEKGARVQRPLWASTSTKNPEYSDVKYVEPLIGPNTVNTMPEETINAFADHGVVEANTIEKNLDDAKQTFVDLKAIGIDIDKVTWQLVNEGIEKFIEPYAALIKNLNQKREQITETI
jgi:transaldolase